MDNSLVVVMGSDRARFFTLEQAEWPEYESGPDLIERDRVVYSDLSYRHRLWSSLLGKSEAEADSSLEHNSKLDNRFGQKIISQIINFVRVNQYEKLILVAPHQILELISEFFIPTLFRNLEIITVEQDVSNLTSLQIQQYLAQKDMVPAYQKAVYPA